MPARHGAHGGGAAFGWDSSFVTGGEEERRYAFRVDDDNMDPRISNNDVMLIDQSQTTPRVGGLYAVESRQWCTSRWWTRCRARYFSRATIPLPAAGDRRAGRLGRRHPNHRPDDLDRPRAVLTLHPPFLVQLSANSSALSFHFPPFRAKRQALRFHPQTLARGASRSFALAPAQCQNECLSSLGCRLYLAGFFRCQPANET